LKQQEIRPMLIRKSDVCWNAHLIRIEFLDERGEPYYCCFESRAETDTVLEALEASPNTCLELDLQHIGPASDDESRPVGLGADPKNEPVMLK
jgi:hypothetical protein